MFWYVIRHYFWYVIRHKLYVFIEACKLGVPWLGVVHDLSKFYPDEFMAYARYFYESERGGQSEGVRRAFSLAWLKHQRRNPHHWQWWLLRKDSPDEQQWSVQENHPGSGLVLAYCGHSWLVEERPELPIGGESWSRMCSLVNTLNHPHVPLPMSDRYRREKLADWRGAGRALGRPDTREWYLENRDNIQLHPDTRAWIERQLGVDAGAALH